MADEILAMRLIELKRTLTRASLSQFRPREEAPDPQGSWDAVALSLPTLEKVLIKPIWTPLETQFKDESKTLSRRITNLEERVATVGDLGDEEEHKKTLEVFWGEYEKLEDQAEELLGEIVELLGGLAFRDRSVDPWFFGIADQLVLHYANVTGDPWDPLTVPSVRHAVARTLARIVGLRFPDWSVWALPLIGYEFAYQYFGFAQKGIGTLEKVKLALGDEFQLDELGDPRMLLADSFATFTTGPAYMFAALGLRFSFREAVRGRVIMRTVELLDKQNLYPKEFLDNFKERWQRSPSSGGALDHGQEKKLERFAKAGFEVLTDSFLDAVRYSTQDWVRAKQIFEAWKADAAMPGGFPLKPPETPPRSRLVDALNAGWLCRFRRIAKPDHLEKATRELCDHILKRQRSAGVGTQQQTAMPAQTGV